MHQRKVREDLGLDTAFCSADCSLVTEGDNSCYTCILGLEKTVFGYAPDYPSFIGSNMTKMIVT